MTSNSHFDGGIVFEGFKNTEPQEILRLCRSEGQPAVMHLDLSLVPHRTPWSFTNLVWFFWCGRKQLYLRDLLFVWYIFAQSKKISVLSFQRIQCCQKISLECVAITKEIWYLLAVFFYLCFHFFQKKNKIQRKRKERKEKEKKRNWSRRKKM